jgi:predicted permease
VSISSLKERAPSTGAGKRLFGLRNLLVMWQISGSLVLLLITGFLALGYRHVNQIDVGFQPRGVYMLSVDPVRDGYAPADVGLLFERLIERAKRIPGVTYASLTDTVPLNLIGAGQPMLFTVDRDATPRRAIRSTVTDGYFETLQVPIVRGRSFNLHDREASPLPVILNEKAVRTLWPDRDALGQVLRSGDRLYQVIGVAQDGKFGMLMEGSPTYIYQPMPRRAPGRSTVSGTTLLVRAAGTAEAIEAALRRAVEEEDPRLTVFNAGSMWDHVNIIFFRIKLGTWTYGGLGLVGLLIAAVGLYGLTSYSVAQRRHEIGLRMALGARRWDILKLVLREALIVLAIGMAIGELMGFAVGRVLASAIQQISAVIGKGTSDLTLLLGVPLLLAVVDLAACYLPARRAALIDPLAALRHE